MISIRVDKLTPVVVSENFVLSPIKDNVKQEVKFF